MSKPDDLTNFQAVSLIMRQKALTHCEKLLMIYFVNSGWTYDEAFVSLKLPDMIGISMRTIRSTVEKLHRIGFIEIESQGIGRADIIRTRERLIKLWQIDQCNHCMGRDNEPVQSLHDTGAIISINGCNHCTHKESIKKSKKNSYTPPPGELNEETRDKESKSDTEDRSISEINQREIERQKKEREMIEYYDRRMRGEFKKKRSVI